MNLKVSRSDVAATRASAPLARPARFALPGDGLGPAAALLLSAVAFALAHTALTWGQLDVLIWRDVGRWLHEVERFGQGETVYRDFSWQFPPLAVWLIGSVARAFGHSLSIIWTTTALIFVGIVIAYVYLVAALVPPPLRMRLTLAGLIFAAAYACIQSAPLPLGMYMPAAPVAGLFYLIALNFGVRLLAQPRLTQAVLVGVFAGLGILTKQDVWLPAVYLAIVGAASLVWAHGRAGQLPASTILAAFGITVTTGIIAVGVTSGWQHLSHILAGYGSVQTSIGRGLPTQERLVTEVAVLAGIIGLGLAFFGQKGANRSTV
ncbi:MAG: hypothetical protein ACREMQ_07310, partial [Longimicrobiales bacterium]